MLASLQLSVHHWLTNQRYVYFHFLHYFLRLDLTNLDEKCNRHVIFPVCLYFTPVVPKQQACVFLRTTVIPSLYIPLAAIQNS